MKGTWKNAWTGLLSLTLSCTLLLGACAPAQSQGEQAEGAADLRPAVERVIFTVGSDKMYINEKEITIKAPYLVNDTTLVPVRAVTEGLGAQVGWDGGENKVSVSKDGVDITLVIDQASAQMNGQTVELLCAPVLDGDTTMVPIRVISEAFGMEVGYDGVKENIVVVKRSFPDAVTVDAAQIDAAKKLACDKIKKTAGNFVDGKFPHGSKDGVYVPEGPGWVGGFYTGLNYLCYDFSGDEAYRKKAEEASITLKNMFYQDKQVYNHDLGFTFLLSYYQDYLLTGSEASKQVVIDAGDALLARAREPLGYIRGWNQWGNSKYGQENNYRMIADSMCNIPLLFICTELTGDEKYAEGAVRHARLTQQYLVRNNYTSAHTFVFTPDGEPKYEQTHQGAYDSSCWARGQAWIINGMAFAYAKTGDASFLDTAKNCIDTYLLKTEADLVPKWDLDYQRMASEPRDSSAAGIIACGMMQIYDETGDEFYYEAAKRLFTSLYENYSTKDDADNEGIILHATGHMPNKQNVDVSLIYGDYYFAELADRLGKKIEN